jgi:N4-gp56 family major capsid protein
MADTNTTTSSLNNLLLAWFSRKIIATLVPKTPLIEFAQRDELPLRTGTTATFNGWNRITAASSTLAEGTVNSLIALSSRKVSATIAGYGRGVKLTDLTTMTTIFDAVNGAMERLADSAAETVERMCQMGIFKANINANQVTSILSTYMSSPVSGFCAVTGTSNASNLQFQFPGVFGASVTRLSAINAAAPTTSAQLSVFAVRKTVTKLRGVFAKPFADGYFVGYAHPNALHSLMKDNTWKDWNQYQNSKETMYKGEVGMAVNGVRFVQSAICPRYAATAHSVNLTFIFGQQAFGFTSLDGNVKMIVARGPDKNDPFDQFTDVTYKIYGVGVALNPSAGRILYTAEKVS